MKHQLIRIAAVATLAVGVMLAQNPNAGPRAGRGGMGQGAHLQQMATQLNLTDDQKAQAKEIFQAAHQSAAPLHQQMRGARQQLATDVKAGASQDVITKDSNAVGVLAGQLAAQEALALQKFYGILTPDQKTKLDTIQTKRRARANG